MISKHYKTRLIGYTRGVLKPIQGNILEHSFRNMIMVAKVHNNRLTLRMYEFNENI